MLEGVFRRISGTLFESPEEHLTPAQAANAARPMPAELSNDAIKNVSFDEQAPPTSPMDVHVQASPSVQAEVAPVSIKNTFIHVPRDDYDSEEEQPPMQSRSVSGPGKLQVSQMMQQEREKASRFPTHEAIPEESAKPCDQVSYQDEMAALKAENAKFQAENAKLREMVNEKSARASLPIATRTGVTGVLPASKQTSVVEDDDSDEEEQPDARRCLSGPFRPNAAKTEPLRIPLAGEAPTSKEDENVSTKRAGEEPRIMSGQLKLTPSPGIMGIDEQVEAQMDEDASRGGVQMSAKTTVKNTFLPYSTHTCSDSEEEEQPNAARSVSGPGHLFSLRQQKEKEPLESSKVVGSGVRRAEPAERAYENGFEPAKVPVLSREANPAVQPQSSKVNDRPVVGKQRSVSAAGPVGKGMKTQPAKIPMRGGESSQGGDGRSRGDSEGDASPLEVWLGLKDDPFGFAPAESSANAAPGSAPIPQRPPGVLPPVGPVGLPPPGAFMSPFAPPGMAGLPPVAFGAPGMPMPGMPGPPGWLGMPGMPMMPPNMGYHMPPMGSPPGAGRGIHPVRPAASQDREDGDQSPLSAWLGVPVAKAEDPFGLAKEEPPKPKFKRIPSGAELPSKGSADHNAGTCRPCAHNWKPNGCSNGKNCTFCHACDEEAFKRCKKEKITRLRDEGVPRRRAEKNKEAGASNPQAMTSDEIDDLVKATTSHAAAPSSPPPQDLEADVPALGPTVSYEGASASIRWSLDLKSFRESAGRLLSRRFSLIVGGSEVEFRFLLNPRDASSATPSRTNYSSTKKARLEATLQMKCMTEGMPGGSVPLRVAFGVGSQPLRVASTTHDFSQMSVCELPPHEAVWDLAMGSENAAKCIVRAELSPVSAVSP